MPLPGGVLEPREIEFANELAKHGIKAGIEHFVLCMASPRTSGAELARQYLEMCKEADAAEPERKSGTSMSGLDQNRTAIKARDEKPKDCGTEAAPNDHKRQLEHQRARVRESLNNRAAEVEAREAQLVARIALSLQEREALLNEQESLLDERDFIARGRLAEVKRKLQAVRFEREDSLPMRDTIAMMQSVFFGFDGGDFEEEEARMEERELFLEDQEFELEFEEEDLVKERERVSHERAVLASSRETLQQERKKQAK